MRSTPSADRATITCYGDQRLAAATATAAAQRMMSISTFVRQALLKQLRADGVKVGKREGSIGSSSLRPGAGGV
jgi:hypothetical protein